MKKIFMIIAAALLLMVQGAWAQDATLIDGVYYVLNNEEKTAEVVCIDSVCSSALRCQHISFIDQTRMERKKL